MSGKIALYSVVLLEIALVYLFAASIDELKFNGTQKTIKLKVFNWYFRHSTKRNEILITTFIRKLIAIVLFFVTAILFILTFFVDLDGKQGVLMFGITFFAIVLYLCYLSSVENHFKKKLYKSKPNLLFEAGEDIMLDPKDADETKKPDQKKKNNEPPKKLEKGVQRSLKPNLLFEAGEDIMLDPKEVDEANKIDQPDEPNKPK